jgi:hypothetical protein
MSEKEAAAKRAIAKVLSGMGRQTSSGMLEIDADVVAAELAKTVSMRRDAPEDGETYDPVKAGQEMARKQIGESRTPDSLAWR